MISHALDSAAFGSYTFNALTSAVVKDRATLTGGSDASPCGFHLFNGLDAEFMSTFIGFIQRYNASTGAAAPNFQALWYASPAESEPGWGVNITHQGDILFGTRFTYGADGRGRWLVMPSLNRQGTSARYSGEIYRTTGTPFNAYDRSRLAVIAAGTASFEFTGASTATFTYTLDGVTQTKSITRRQFGAQTTGR